MIDAAPGAAGEWKAIGEGTGQSVRATYRLQLTGSFGFDHARPLVSYLSALGVSHLYLSPIMQARAGIDPRL